MSGPVTHARALQVVADALQDDGARALAILAELQEPGMPDFTVHQARPLRRDADWPSEYYAIVWIGCEKHTTGRHRSLLGLLAAIVGMVRVGSDVDAAFDVMDPEAWNGGAK